MIILVLMLAILCNAEGEMPTLGGISRLVRGESQSMSQTAEPSTAPSSSPTSSPSTSPSSSPTASPSSSPTTSPSTAPTESPTSAPTLVPRPISDISAQIVDPGLSCGPGLAITTEKDCRKNATALGIPFSSEGMHLAPGGCYWYHNSDISKDGITNIGFNSDLKESRSVGNFIGRVCKERTSTDLSSAPTISPTADQPTQTPTLEMNVSEGPTVSPTNQPIQTPTQALKSSLAPSTTPTTGPTLNSTAGKYEGEILDSGLECNAGSAITTEHECRQYATALGITFSSVGIVHAPGGCYWHHNTGMSDYQITNIGFNSDLKDNGSGWGGVGRVCKKVTIAVETTVEPVSEKVTWTYVGYGGCTNGNWRNIGNANSIEEAQEMVLADDICSRHGSIMFYSDYSYAWGVRCTTSEHHGDCQKQNPNWGAYILTYASVEGEILDSGLECNAGSAITTEHECRQYAAALGITFSSVGIVHAPGGCYWHHNTGMSDDQITNIGFNSDLKDNGSGWGGVGRVCKTPEYIKYGKSQCYANTAPHDGDSLNNPIFGGSGFIGQMTGTECEALCNDPSYVDEHGRECVAFEHSSQNYDAVANCALAWACDYTKRWNGGTAYIRAKTNPHTEVTTAVETTVEPVSESEYALGSIGATECPKGYAYITSMSECDSAQQTFANIVGWNGDQLRFHGARMPFCWLGSAKKANYNQDGDWGSYLSKSALICKRYDFALIDGAPSSGRSPAEIVNPDPTRELGQIQCCSTDGTCTRRWPWSLSSHSDCLSGSGDASKVTLQEAVRICGKLGSEWSLCTRAQTNNNNCKWKGCSYDSHLVWVKDTPSD